jgi:hypothetical protein
MGLSARAGRDRRRRRVDSDRTRCYPVGSFEQLVAWQPRRSFRSRRSPGQHRLAEQQPVKSAKPDEHESSSAQPHPDTLPTPRPAAHPRKPASTRSLLLHHAVPEMRHRGRLDHADALQLGVRRLEILQQPRPVAKQDWREVDLQLVEQSGA